MRALVAPVGACVLAGRVVVVRHTPSWWASAGSQRLLLPHAAVGSVARVAGGTNISSNRARTIRLMLHARALR